jgi:HEAT repeat protein
VELLRAFGGAEALPDLKALIGDAEPGIQREALRAIMQIGTDEAYATLADAIKSSEAQTRSTIMQVLSSSHDERAAPLFIYILDHTDYRGDFEGVYRLAVESLGHLGGDPGSVEALKKVLYRGEWWAPGRTRRLRAAAATALRACGSPASHQALEAAAQEGPGGVRRAAKAALDAPAPRTARRTN